MVHRQRMFDKYEWDQFMFCDEASFKRKHGIPIVRAFTRTTAPALCCCFAPVHASLVAQSSSWSMQY